MEEILSSYIFERRGIEDKETKFAYLVENLPTQIADYLAGIGTISRYKAIIERETSKYKKQKGGFTFDIGGNKIDMKDLNTLLGKTAKSDHVYYTAKNVAQFFRDLGMGEEAVGSIIAGLMDREFTNPVYKGDELVTDKDGKVKFEEKPNELVQRFLAEIVSLDGAKNKVFSDAFATITKARGDEAKVKDPEAATKATSFAKKGEFVNGNKPSAAVAKAFGNKLEAFLTLSNLNILLPQGSKQRRVKQMQNAEKDPVDEGLKNLFNRML
jgi:hypothetical protein